MLTRPRGFTAFAVVIVVLGAALIVASIAISRPGARAALEAVLPGASNRDEAGAPTPEAVLLAAGDIGMCEGGGGEATAELVERLPGTVAALGDNVYENGSTDEYADCYAPHWGRLLSRTRPAAGNHEYHSEGAAPYFAYFGNAAGPAGRGWYSYDLGSWHVVVLNSNCDEVGGCGGGSAQWLWLRQDLAAHPATCTLAYWHAPRFSSGEHGPAQDMVDVWRVLYDARAELVISGHDHEYERFAPQDPVGNRDDARGVRQFVVGTGGGELRAVSETAANSEELITHTYGVMRLDLYPGRFAWSFLSVRDATLDSGSADCH
jgi:calcineurin-like phosphoesterase family protein